VIRDYVYHPELHGSFNLKDSLHPLVPHLTYDDLIIVDGMVASLKIALLLFVAGEDSTGTARQDAAGFAGLLRGG